MTSGSVDDLNGQAARIRNYKSDRKKILDVLNSKTYGPQAKREAETKLGEFLATIENARQLIASFEAAAKNLTPILNQVEPQVRKDMAALSTAEAAFEAHIHGQFRAVDDVLQKLGYARQDFDATETEWQRSKHVRYLSELDDRSKSFRQSIDDRWNKIDGALSQLKQQLYRSSWPRG